MGGDVHREDRASGGHGIEIGAGEVPPLLEHRVVVSKSDQPIVSRLRCIDLPQCIESLRNGSDRSDRRAVEVGCNRHEPRSREVAMRFDESGHDRPPLEVELDVGSRQPGLHVRIAPNRNDSVVFDHERRGLTSAGIHREDVPLGPNLKPRWRRVQTHPHHAPAHDEQHRQGEQRPGGSLDDCLHTADATPERRIRATLEAPDRNAHAEVA